jgi:hypothetical protein
VLGRAIFLAASLIWSAATSAQTASLPLVLEAKILLGQVSGRIDHLGIDLKRLRLLVPSSATTAWVWWIWRRARRCVGLLV